MSSDPQLRDAASAAEIAAAMIRELVDADCDERASRLPIAIDELLTAAGDCQRLASTSFEGNSP